MQKLTVDYLKQTDSYVGAPVEKTVKWTVKGAEHEALVLVKLSSYETAINEHEIRLGGQDVLVARIVSSLIDEQGKPVFTPLDITGNEQGEGKMCASLFMALAMAVNEANGYTGDEVKK